MQQADAYLDAIKTRINRLKSDYSTGVFDDEVGEDIQRVNAQKHVVYYRVTSDKIERHSVLGPGQNKYERFAS